MQIEVNVQEVLSKKIMLDIPEGINASEIEGYIYDKIQELYACSNGQSILASEDFSGYSEIRCENEGELIEFSIVL